MIQSRRFDLTLRINSLLSDEEIEDCIDGSSDVRMLREIIEMTQLENLLDEKDFADHFADRIRGFIDADISSDEYLVAYENNYNWGFSIAENINSLLVSKWTT